MPRLILRTGLDMLDFQRLEDLDPAIRQRFLKRVFTPKELELSGDSNPTLGGRFCVKEAAAKALGCGIGTVSWQDIETTNDADGAPVIVLHGKAKQMAADLGLTSWAVSITHTRTIAAASVTAIGLISV